MTASDFCVNCFRDAGSSEISETGLDFAGGERTDRCSHTALKSPKSTISGSSSEMRSSPGNTPSDAIPFGDSTSPGAVFGTSCRKCGFFDGMRIKERYDSATVDVMRRNSGVNETKESKPSDALRSVENWGDESAKSLTKAIWTRDATKRLTIKHLTPLEYQESCQQLAVSRNAQLISTALVLNWNALEGC